MGYRLINLSIESLLLGYTQDHCSFEWPTPLMGREKPVRDAYDKLERST